MPELERRLRELAAEWPATPDIAAAVAERLRSEPAPRPADRRRRAALAAAILALLAGALGAIEPARSAVLEWLGLKSVRIERRAPAPPPASSLDLGTPVTLAQARRRAGFDARPPSELATPAEIRERDGLVSFVYGRGRRRVLVSEALATVEPVIGKSVGPGTRLRRVRDGDARGYFLSGAPHGFAYLDPHGRVTFEDQRLAGNTLLLERGGLLIRVEGRIGLERALQIARSVTATSGPPPG